MVSEIQPRQKCSRRPPTNPDTMGENNTLTALKGCGVKLLLFYLVTLAELKMCCTVNLVKLDLN